MAINPDEFRAALGRFATGVTILTTRDRDGRDHGMTVSAFASVSLVPPLVLACIDRGTDMYEVIRTASHFGISVLAEGQEAFSRRFAELPSGGARFDGIGYTRAESGVILLDDALAHLECRQVGRHEAGDHAIHLGEVEWVSYQQDRPLLYYRGGYAQMER
ncbi:MAG TPA: flavin reductase family protein [Gemmatimonadaceae bacterium]|nr:flavin reductase family protein [Gemmatimonadaceae bacterium]